MENDSLKKYEYYIEAVTEDITNIFEYQKEYICCSNGCSGCCESGMYPFSNLEFEYIKLGYNTLSEETKNKIKENINILKKEYNGEHFMHKCPFLIDGSCSVYKYRGIICRTFGLITENSEGNLTLPYCASCGLNYSTVYDSETKRISEEKVKKLGYKIMPKAYNLSRQNMMNLSITKTLNLNFGESRMLFEWMLDYLSEQN